MSKLISFALSFFSGDKKLYIALGLRQILKLFIMRLSIFLRIESLMIMLDVMLMALMRHVIFIFQK
ncbi:hypothetical protein VWO27_10055 [Campylobacter coli]|nr:hypothetical protein [Campylobacter coli]MED7858404.1 hypothetical protein [Campylobacter coli]